MSTNEATVWKHKAALADQLGQEKRAEEYRAKAAAAEKKSGK